MFAQHPGNQGRERGVDGHRKKEEGDKEKENHIAAKSLLVSFSIPLCLFEASLHYKWE